MNDIVIPALVWQPIAYCLAGCGIGVIGTVGMLFGLAKYANNSQAKRLHKQLERESVLRNTKNIRKLL